MRTQISKRTSLTMRAFSKGCVAAVIFGGLSAVVQPTGLIAADETPIVQDDFQGGGPKQWLWNGDIQSGELILTVQGDTKYAGAQTLLRSPISLAQGGKDATHIHFKVNSLSEVNGQPPMAEARIFLEPDPLKLPTFADPYGDPNALTLLIRHDSSGGSLKAYLYKKSDQPTPGYGIPLYSATIPQEKFPITVDWYLSRTGYRIKFGPQAQSIDGSKQGALELGPSWNGDVRLIMRAVNLADGIKSQLRIADFSIAAGLMPSE